MNNQEWYFDWAGLFAGLGIAWKITVIFCAVCYVLLAPYLMFRLGRNASRDAKYQREMMHAVGMLRFDIQQMQRQRTE